MTKKDRESRLEEQRATIRGIIAFHRKEFTYKESSFYLKGCTTETWYEVEHTADKADMHNLSQIMVKDLDAFITSGPTFSLQEKIAVSEIIPIIKQSLHVPLDLDVMYRIITIQERLSKQKWHYFYPGILFLGSKLTVVKAKGWEHVNPELRHEVGEIYYPVLQFRDYTIKGQGLWLPEVVHENDVQRNFTAAVYI